MPDRGRFQGMLSIARFNWPFYAVAIVALAAGTAGTLLFPPGWPRFASLAIVAGCLWFLAGSLGVSHWVYDRSDLYRWNWLDRILRDPPPSRALVCHTGFDEVSEALRERFPAIGWTVIDHFDPRTMTEPSIRRARRRHPPAPGTIPAAHDAWPPLQTDLVLGLLAIHELRSPGERAAWFVQARSSLTPGGRIVLVEHVRDLANFAAFGPGFLHFHGVGAWRASWERASLHLTESFRITPFLRAFVLRP